MDIILEKVVMIKNCKFSFRDDYIEKYLAEKERNLTATWGVKAAYFDVDFVVIVHLQTAIDVHSTSTYLRLKR